MAAWPLPPLAAAFDRAVAPLLATTHHAGERAAGEQLPNNLHPALLACHEQRRVAVIHRRIHRGAPRKQRPNNLQVAKVAGDEEGRDAVALCSVHRGAPRKQLPRRFHAPLLCGPLQRRPSRPVL